MIIDYQKGVKVKYAALKEGQRAQMKRPPSRVIVFENLVALGMKSVEGAATLEMTEETAKP